MWTRKNKTRLWEWDFTIQKPMANDVVMRNWLFVSLQNGYIVPATPQLPIEWCAINDRYSGENNEHRYCIYQPKRNWETFTMEVENGTLKQADVGKTFRIVWVDQHINYSTKADFGGQFRLEEILTDTLWTFTYNFDVQFAPQGPQGNDGETPSLQIGTVTKLQPDQNPTAQLVQDPDDPNMYTLNLGIPAWAQGPRWYQGDKWDTGNPGSAWAPGQDWANGTNWTNGTNWVSPHREWNWNGGTTYTYLAMVRYPDQNNEYWTWIRTDTEPTSGSTPGVDSRRWKMNKDGEPGPQGDQGGTIVVPVEWKPGKDWIWVDGRDWVDWNSPHDEWIWSATVNYSPLAMVRAFTGEYDQRGNEIRGYYITENWAYQDNPKDWSPRQLVAKDWQAGKGNPYTVMVWLWEGIDRTNLKFNVNWNLPVDTWLWDEYTGNRDMVQDSKFWIQIIKTGHYRIFWHCIVQSNTGSNQYINLWRFSIILRTSRTGSLSVKYIATSKMWWPSSTWDDQGPWLDLHIDTQMDLYEWDMLIAAVRMQSDDIAAQNQNAWDYRVIGSDDTSWDDPDGQFIWWFFPTYMWVEYISRHTWQENDVEKIVWDL